MSVKKNFNLSGKVYVITGGAGLLGREFVKTIVENKGTAIIADKNEVLGLKVKKRISKEFNSSKVDFVKIDINSKNKLNNIIEYLDKKYGRIDALINNAYPKNKNYGKSFFDIEYKDFVQNLEMHLGGYFLTSQKFSKYFKKQGYGNIINICSIYGTIVPRFGLYDENFLPTPIEYIVIKSGIIHLTKYMAKFFHGMNIRVNSLSPGGIYDKQPENFVQKYKKLSINKGMLNVNDLNGSLLFLLSDMSKYLNGQNIIVDDGFSL